MIDSHCHLDFAKFEHDRAEILARAKAVGVTAYINPGCTIASSTRAVALAVAHAEIYAAVGIHPHDAAEVTPDVLTQLAQFALNAKVVAIGEIGLDYYQLGGHKVDGQEIDVASLEELKKVQHHALRQQLALAHQLQKPVILHTREAEADTLMILAEFPEVVGVAHCYTGSLETAEELVRRGWCIGLTGIITFKHATNLWETVKAIPLDKILIETDAPYLAPEPYRGKRAEPSHVVQIAKKIAGLKNVSLTDVDTVTTANTKRVFSL